MFPAIISSLQVSPAYIAEYHGDVCPDLQCRGAHQDDEVRPGCTDPDQISLAPLGGEILDVWWVV